MRPDERQAIEAFTREFRCPRHDGKPVPCWRPRRDDWDKRPSKLYVPGPHGRSVECPIWETDRCEPGTRYAAELREYEDEIWLDEGQRMGIRKSHLEASFATSDETPTLGRARKYVDEEAPQGICLVLFGGPGAGKTWGAVCALREWAARTRDTYGPRILDFSQLCREIHAFATQAGAMELARRPRLIVFDEFGADAMLRVHEPITELLHAREADRLPTILTTNMSVSQFETSLKDATVDRLRGPWGAYFQCGGQSLRRARRAPGAPR